MSDALGERLLLAIVEDEDLISPRKKGVGADSLFDEARQGYEFIEDYRHNHGAFPNRKQLEDKIGRTLPAKAEPCEFVAGEVRKRSLANRLKDVLKKAIEALDDRDPDQALETVQRGARELKEQASANAYENIKPAELKNVEPAEYLILESWNCRSRV